MEHTHPTVHSTSPSLTHPNPATAATRGPVLVIGVGLIGGSIGLALTREGLPVYLRDASPTAVALATSLGAGKADPGKLPLSEAASLAPMPPPNLVVVAAPPDVTAPLVIAALHEFPQACVLDVASVKVTHHRRSAAPRPSGSPALLFGAPHGGQRNQRGCGGQRGTFRR